MADLTVNLGKLKLKNPVMTASGTFGYGSEYADLVPLDKLGAVVVKGIAPGPVHGNPTPRIAEVTSGMLNAIGLQGPGVEKFLHADEYLPYLRRSGATVIVNIWGKSLDDYRHVAERLEAEGQGVAAIEINVSCPNVKEGGISFGTDPKMMAKVIAGVRAATKIPLITKLSPNVSRVGDFAIAARDAGSDMVSLINTIPAMAIDIDTFRPKLANVTGGLSGPAIKPIAVRMVYEAAKAVEIPVIGMGGIMCADDAIEFFLAGAKAVAIGTASFVDPQTSLKAIDGIDRYLDAKGFKSISEIVGAVRLG